MNSNSRNVWYVVGAVVLIALIAWFVGFRADKMTPDETAQMTGTSTVDGTEGSATNGTANGTQGGTRPAGSGATAGTGAGASAVLSDAALNTIISNSLIRVPQGGIDVALTSGQGTFKDGAKQGRVSVGPVLARLSTDDKTTDAFAVLTYSADKQAEVQYIAVFHVVGQNVRYTSAYQVGTNVVVRGVKGAVDTSAQIQNSNQFSTLLGYNLTVSYLTRKNGEPTTAAPSVEQTTTVKVKNHVISAR